MKVAVTYQDDQVFQHFGASRFFKIYEVENGEINGSRVVPTNGAGHGALVAFLRDQKVSTLLCGGIGTGAKEYLAEAGIEVYPGVTGDPDGNVRAYLAGKLTFNSGVTCSHYEEEHGGGSHVCGEHGCGRHDHGA